MKSDIKNFVVGLLAILLACVALPSFAESTRVAQNSSSQLAGSNVSKESDKGNGAFLLARRGGGGRVSVPRAPRPSVPHHRPPQMPPQRPPQMPSPGVHRKHVSHTVRADRYYRLPSGCNTTAVLSSIIYYHCDGIYYRPYYEGTTVVYVIETP